MSNIFCSELELSEMKKMFRSIKRCVFSQEISKEMFCIRYNISDEYFDYCIELFDKDNIVKLKLVENEKKYALIKQLCHDIPRYLDTGIDVNGDNIPFTGLDYYAFTHESPKKFKAVFMNAYEDDNFKYYNKLITMFFNRISDMGAIFKKQDFLNMKITFYFGDNAYAVTEEIVDYIFEVFEENNIPYRRNLLEKATERYLRNQPILPFKDALNNEKGHVLIKK